MLPDQNLHLLKKYVLLRASVAHLIPSDCKRLAMIISKTVKKNISETTIKRLYGFAEAKHNFSKFTLTALSEYVGKESWEKFCEDLKDSKQQLLSKWDELNYKAGSVTSSALKIIRNKSVIPYHLTINREFAERHFESFYHYDYSFTSFVAQPGYGKSVLLSHLSDKFFIKENCPYKDDMYWFINPGVLNNTEYFDLELWLNSQLGDGLNFIQYFKEDPSRRKGKIVIVLDGFDEIIVKKDQLKNFLIRLSNFICSNDTNDWLKIVLSMRSATWIAFYESIRHSAYLKSKLFLGDHVKMDEFVNVPPLSDKEIDLILNKFTNIDLLVINHKLKALFKYPFYLQVYYQLNQEGKAFDNNAQLTFYELLAVFVNEKINLSQHYTEKTLLLKKIILLTKKNKRGNIVFKEDLLSDISVFREAYEQLIVDGILIEEKQADHLMPKEVVRFVHHHIYEYFLFIQIIDSNPRNINHQLFDIIHSEYNSSLKLQLLEWSVRHAIINQNSGDVIEFLRLKLPAQEKKSLMLFILQTLEYKYGNNKNGRPNKIIDEYLHKAFLHELLQLDFLGPCYKEVLLTIRRLTSQPDEMVIYTSLLAYIAVVELDTAQLKAETDELRLVRGYSEKWIFLPHQIFHEIYLKLVNREEPNSSLLEEIENFTKDTHPENADLTVELTISYLGAFLVNFLSGNFVANVRLFSKVKEVHPHIFRRRGSLAVYLLNIVVINAARLDDNFNSDKILNLLTKLENSKKNACPDYFNVLFLLVKSENYHSNRDYESAIDFAEKCMRIGDSKNIAFLKVLLLIFLSNIYEKMEKPEAAREIRYQLHCLLEEKNIDMKCFINYKTALNLNKEA